MDTNILAGIHIFNITSLFISNKKGNMGGTDDSDCTYQVGLSDAINLICDAVC